MRTKKIKPWAEPAKRGPGRPPGPKHDPWQMFRREVLRTMHTIQELAAVPVLGGTPVAIETITGARVSGVVMGASVLGIKVDTLGGHKSKAVYIPMSTIDLMEVMPEGSGMGEDAPEAPPPPDLEEPDEPADTDPDLPPDDDEGAPDAHVVP